MTLTIVSEVSSGTRVVGTVPLRAVGFGIGMRLAIGDRAADDRACGQSAQDGRAIARAMSMPMMVPVRSMPMSILNLLHARAWRGRPCRHQRAASADEAADESMAPAAATTTKILRSAMSSSLWLRMWWQRRDPLRSGKQEFGVRESQK